MSDPAVEADLVRFAAELPVMVPAKDVAGIFGVSRGTIRRWARIGKLATSRATPAGSGRTLVPRAEVLRLLRSMTP